jgi:hypothetical protein
MALTLRILPRLAKNDNDDIDPIFFLFFIFYFLFLTQDGEHLIDPIQAEGAPDKGLYLFVKLVPSCLFF